jgi:hypothetical protein
MINVNDRFLSDDWDFLRIVSQDKKPLYTYFFSNYQGEYQGGSYRPMVNVFWTFNFFVWKFNEVGYHVMTIVFHVVNTLLLYALIQKLSWWKEDRMNRLVAGSSAFIFAILPAHAEAVSWIAAVNDPMMTLFYLSSLWSLVHIVNAKPSSRYMWYVVSLVFYAAALLTKEMAISLPAVAMIGIVVHRSFGVTSPVYKVRELGLSMLYAIKYTIPYVVVSALYLVVRWAAIGSVLQSYASEVGVNENVLFSYLSFIVGQVMSGEWRSVVTRAVFEHVYVISGVSMVLGLAAVLSLWRTVRYRVMSAAILWWAVSIIPVSHFVLHTSEYLNEEGERWLYLPSIFFAIGVGIGAAYCLDYLKKNLHNRERKKIYIGIFGVSFFILIGIYWYSALWQKTIRWNEGANVLKSAHESLREVLVRESYDGVVLVGRPELYQGVLLMRTPLSPYAVSLMTGIRADVMPVVDALYLPGQSMGVSRVDEQTFVYRSMSGDAILTPPTELYAVDYEVTLGEITRDRMSGRITTDEIVLRLSDEFLRHNRGQNKKIGILFFDQGVWIPFTF